jgi:hypothetical protein
MSQQFCYLETPDIEKSVFWALSLFNTMIDQTDWDTSEAEVSAGLSAIEARVGALEARLAEVRKDIIQLNRAYLGL